MTRCAPCSARRIFAKARWLSRRNARHAGAANRNATMDLNWSDADLAFRDEVRAFLADAVDDDLRAAGTRLTSVSPDHHARSERRRVGKESVRTCRSGGSAYTKKKTRI